MTEYRYNKEDHIHEILDMGVYKPLVGTSTMANVLAKPGLTYWASGLAVGQLGWINKGNSEKGWTPKEKRLEMARAAQEMIKEMSPEEYLNHLDKAYSAHTSTLKSSAKSGIDMHAVMEEYVKRCIETNNGIPLPVPEDNSKLCIFAHWAHAKVRRFLWSEGHCYSREFWLGGISDCGFEDVDGKYAILDFKSSKDVYLSQFWQCVGYAMQIEENGVFDSNGNNIFKLDKPIEYVAVLPFGMDKPEVKYNVDMAGGREAVKAMLLLHNKLK